jgi:hypothetical protein
MSKSNWKRRKAHKQEQFTAKTPDDKINTSKSNSVSKVWTRTKKVRAGVLTILGIASSVVTFYCLLPKVVIQPSSILDPHDPFTTQFEILNDGYLDMHKVKIVLALHDVKFQSGLAHITMGNIGIGNKISEVDLLSAGERTSLACESLMPMQKSVETADMAVWVEYRPSFAPWKFSKIQRFVAKKDIEGNFHWVTFSEPESHKASN